MEIRIEKFKEGGHVIWNRIADGWWQMLRRNSTMTKELVKDHVLNVGNQNLRLDTGDDKTHPADSPFYDKLLNNKL